jgi:hypothetical protein
LHSNFWFCGGFPEPWLNPGDTFRARWVERYIQTYLFREVKRGCSPGWMMCGSVGSSKCWGECFLQSSDLAKFGLHAYFATTLA